MRSLTRSSILALALTLSALLAAGGPALQDRLATVAAGSGLLNPGFEQGNLDGVPLFWDVVKPVPDAVKVVDAEGPLEFPTYRDMGNVTVSPYRGNLMLRLGTPRQISQNQPPGDNSVSQSFTADSTTVSFAFRLFSWEERGLDVFRFRLTGPTSATVTGAPTDRRLSGTCTRSAGSLECRYSIDVGKQGDFLASDWQVVTLAGLTKESNYVLSYTTGGTNNSAHATWAYFDNVNTPPVAKFTFTPPNPTEGDTVRFQDLSCDPDPGDAITSWKWTVAGPSTNITSTAQNPSFIVPQDGRYDVSLTVTDKQGASTTVRSGQAVAASPCSTAFEAKFVDVTNHVPLVNALNVEARRGDDVPLFGRFIDPGWLDTHAATWTITPTAGSPNTITVTGVITEQSRPPISTGIVTGTIVGAVLSNTLASAGVPVTATGSLTVREISGTTVISSTVDTFVITVLPLPDNPESREPFPPSLLLPQSPVLTTDSAYLSYVQSPADIDVFQVMWPGLNQPPPLPGSVPANAKPLPLGTEVLVTLKDLPADYDLALLAVSPSGTPAVASQDTSQIIGFKTATFQMSDWEFGDWEFGDWEFGDWEFGDWEFGDWEFGDWEFGDWEFGDWEFGDWEFGPYQLRPLSQVGFTGLDGTQTGGTDIGQGEVALGSMLAANPNARVVGFSANRGQQPEILLTRIDVPQTQLYAVVLGANGARSALPYRLQIESSMPAAAVGSAFPAGKMPEAIKTQCITGKNPLVRPAAPEITLPGPYADPWTLFVTQRERLQATYGITATTQLTNALSSLAALPSVRGEIVSVASSIYDAWDEKPCDVGAANDVSVAIRGVISGTLQSKPSIRYVVLVGGDDVVPYHRVPDETVIGNERYYANSSFLKPGSPLLASIEGGYILSDDYYVDRDPQPWQDGEFYVPDQAIGRLVETPGEILLAVDAFVSSGGVLTPTSAFVSGYDFFSDGATAMANNLASRLNPTDRLINDGWSAAELRCRLLGLSGCTARDVNAINAHFTHYAAISAGGFASETLDLLTSTDVVSATRSLSGTVIFTIGCHAGLSVPDASAEAADLGLGFDPRLDFAQAMAKKRAVYVASTGFGLGDDEYVAGTELLLANFARELVRGGDVTVGQALRQAKLSYLSSLSTMTAYEVKSSIQTSLYGLPMYSIYQVPATPGSGSLAAATQSVESGLSVTLNVSDTGTISTTSYVIQPATRPDGSYFKAGPDGLAQATAGRAIQPKVVESISASAGPPAHGVLLTGGTFTETTGFNPVIARPTNEWELSVTEPQICLPNWWPSELATVNTLDAFQTLVAVPGQFRCTSGTAPTVTGTQRLYSSLSLELLRSNSSDWQPPTVSSLDLRPAGGGVDVTVTVSDTSGIVRIVVLRIPSGTGNLTITQTSLPLSQPYPTSGTFTVTVPIYSKGDALVVQVADGAGNVYTDSGKGANRNLIRVSAGPDQFYVPGVPVTFTATISNFNSLVQPVSFVWDFGDGGYDSGVVSTGTFTVTHSYGEAAPLLTAKLKVTDAGGGVGVDDVVLQRCRTTAYDARDGTIDPNADLVGACLINDTTTMSITLRVAGTIVNDYQYRVALDIGGKKGKDPDNVLDVLLRYAGGQVTGLNSLQAIPSGNDVTFTFNLGEIDRIAGDRIQLFAETQAGVPATPETGKIDSLPDSEWVEYVIR